MCAIVRTYLCSPLAQSTSKQSLCAKGSRDLAARGPLTHGLRAGPTRGAQPSRPSHKLHVGWKGASSDELGTGPPASAAVSGREELKTLA
jgi:hypothetical protein